MKNKSPIYFVNLTGHITTGTSKKVNVVKIDRIVAKGNIEQIKKRDVIKKRFLKKYLKSDKKVSAFDLDRLTIVDVEVKESLGYGTPL